MNEAVASEKTAQFAQAAREYLDFIAQHEVLDDLTFFRNCASILVRLYSAALDLPNVKPCMSIADEIEEFVLPEALQNGLKLLHSQLPSDFGFLYDDLHDIVSDLFGGLRLYERNHACAHRNAVWLWKLQFYVHWGKHLTNALSELHDQLAEPMSHAGG
jgi:hypothetical protein